MMRGSRTVDTVSLKSAPHKYQDRESGATVRRSNRTKSAAMDRLEESRVQALKRLAEYRADRKRIEERDAKIREMCAELTVLVRCFLIG